ncbi:ARM repeat superfamily protein [Heracleum sosnowskyi]|uniref:ARM repeat superfamily protein n=1 Tax=Heracleum sosnowskyi TaxID=360622 RepID=A0AAD8I6X0_9APIA|nr:ARM repeat superfamily protein [Heracleum sosnowskyi]
MAIKKSKIQRCIKAPIRALGRARDLYIRTMNNLAGKIHSTGGALSYPSASVAVLPRSFSVNSASGRYKDGDFRELLRVASARSLGNKVELDSIRRQQSFPGKTTVGECKVVQVPRTQNVGIGRIDEDHTCDFSDVDIHVKKTEHVFPRSRSSAAVMNKY